jgi:16S rRNA A1518/A1519 N6-dimethyltransferase RsmA/KsgA/DIM1 with predicted DNA glycosylase/AP lyase activity
VGVGSSVLEVGCGTGQATRPLAALGCSVTAVEPGRGMAALASTRLVALPKVSIEISRFEDWDDQGSGAVTRAPIGRSGAT